MAQVSTYLNFPRCTEEAFQFYRKVFRSEFRGPILRVGDAPGCGDQQPAGEADKNLVMHVAMPILGGHVLMGSDVPESTKFKVVQGNNVLINLEPDDRTEADRLFKALSEGGTVEMPLQEMFWGDYFGSIVDRFGIHWLFNCASKV
ncbi:VOC family protein [Mesoterricola silvestris]|uniref:VOC family protein n=1 Tax=Mesoterricola silvestris TaxID=2927979 RepID=A0AA48K8R4_9BACT|nr:VOC family protein [Mesoterricola silvestris]BDU73204.1 VOC family protein [Mesoterricola silvestris]